MASEEQDLYNASMNQLAQLVKQRNDRLLQLETMSTLPLSISPRTGHVAEFDTEAAQALLDRVRQANETIGRCMAEINLHAKRAGLPMVQWLAMPGAGRELEGTDG